MDKEKVEQLRNLIGEAWWVAYKLAKDNTTPAEIDFRVIEEELGQILNVFNTAIKEESLNQDICSKCGITPLPEDSQYYHCESCRK